MPTTDAGMNSLLKYNMRQNKCTNKYGDNAHPIPSFCLSNFVNNVDYDCWNDKPARNAKADNKSHVMSSLDVFDEELFNYSAFVIPAPTEATLN